MNNQTTFTLTVWRDNAGREGWELLDGDFESNRDSLPACSLYNEQLTGDFVKCAKTAKRKAERILAGKSFHANEAR